MSTPNAINRFSTSALLVLVARLVAFVSIFGFNAILARALKPEEFGLFALLFSLATLACLIGSCGMNRAMVKLLADESKKHTSASQLRLVRYGLTVAAFSGAVVGALSFLILNQFLVRESTLSFSLLFGLIVLTRNIHFVLAETARGFHETIWSNLFGSPAGGAIPHLLFLTILLFLFCTSESLSLCTTLIVYLGCFSLTLPPLVIRCMSLASRNQLEGPDPTVSSSEIWTLAIPLMLTQTLGLALCQADIWLAGALITPAVLAIYCCGQRMLAFLTIPLQISGTAIISMVPQLISQNKKDELQDVLGFATAVASAPAILIGIVLLAFPETILSIAFGEFYAQAAPVLRLLVLGQLICVLTGPCETVLMMAGHQRKTLLVNLVTAVSILLAGSFSLIQYGIVGLASAMCLITACQNIFNCWLCSQFLGVATYFRPSALRKAITSFVNKLSLLLNLEKANAIQ